jgi:hypothetical protein
MFAGLYKSMMGFRVSVVPTGAERSEAQWRDLFSTIAKLITEERSLHCASLRSGRQMIRTKVISLIVGRRSLPNGGSP